VYLIEGDHGEAELKQITSQTECLDPKASQMRTTNTRLMRIISYETHFEKICENTGRNIIVLK
jgi:hypothetical protein